MQQNHRSPSAIARDICAAIAEQYHEKPAAKQPAFITYARPYLQALRLRDDWDGMYGADTVKSCGLYALYAERSGRRITRLCGRACKKNLLCI